jgi:hypothetical protein
MSNDYTRAALDTALFVMMIGIWFGVACLL